MVENIEILNKIEKTCEFCERNFTHKELMEVLRGDVDSQKQICLLKIDTLESQKEADLLVFHLTGHHGTVRESAAQKINEFVLGKISPNGKYNNLFQTKYVMDSILLAVNDINPNICRLIIETLPAIEDKAYFLEKLYARFECVFEELEKLKRSNWYTKKLFNLYWCLEALAVIAAPVDSRLESVLNRSGRFRDYTIREKTALVLLGLGETPLALEELKKLLKNDHNFYVKRFAQNFT